MPRRAETPPPLPAWMMSCSEASVCRQPSATGEPARPFDGAPSKGSKDTTSKMPLTRSVPYGGAKARAALKPSAGSACYPRLLGNVDGERASIVVPPAAAAEAAALPAKPPRRSRNSSSVLSVAAPLREFSGTSILAPPTTTMPTTSSTPCAVATPLAGPRRTFQRSSTMLDTPSVSGPPSSPFSGRTLHASMGHGPIADMDPGELLQGRRSSKKTGEAAVAFIRSGETWKDRVFGCIQLAALGRRGLAFAPSVALGLNDWHPKVRIAAARALRAMGSSASAPHALHLASLALRDTHREVRQAAEETLRSISANKNTSICSSPDRSDLHGDSPLVNPGESLPAALQRLFSSAALPTAEPASEVALVEGLQPQCWGIRLSQLLEFRNEVFDESDPDNLHAYCKCHNLMFVDGAPLHVCLKDVCPYGDHRGVPFIPLCDAPVGCEMQSLAPNMHAVVGREIKPRTKTAGCSYALMKNPQGLEITAFVTHTWEERFDQFVGTLEMALRPEEVVWVCSFALDQNADISKLLDSDDLLCSPFAKALRHAPKLMVTLDEELKVPERSWCAFELEKASQWGIPTFMWPYHLTNIKELEDRVMNLDVRRATATCKADQERIHREIQEGVGYDAMNTRLRAFLCDRLRFYEAAVSKHVDQFKALSREMELARQEKDQARFEALEAERLVQCNMLQMDMERKAWVGARTSDLEGGFPAREEVEKADQEEQQEWQRQQLQLQMESDLEAARRARDEAGDALRDLRKNAEELAAQLQHTEEERDQAFKERHSAQLALQESRLQATSPPPPPQHGRILAYQSSTRVTMWPTPPFSAPSAALDAAAPAPPSSRVGAVAARTSPSSAVHAAGRGGHTVGVQHSVQRSGEAYQLHSVVTFTPL